MWGELSPSLIAVLAITVAAVVFFVTEWLPPALVALCVMGSLLVSGIIGPEAGFSGFSDSATLTVAAMFVLSAGLEETGFVDRVGRSVASILQTHRRLGWLAIMAGAAVSSGFINNTAVVAVLIPILIRSAMDADMSPSRLLMPLSFASMFGGVCTLMGTSTNLIVSSIADDHGYRPLGFFEMLPLGVVFLGVGLVYLYLTRRFIPERRSERYLTASFAMEPYLTRVTIEPSSSAVGVPLSRSPLVEDLDLEIVAVRRGDEPLRLHEELVLEAGDDVRVLGRRDAIAQLGMRDHLTLGLGDVWDPHLEDEDMMLVEVVVGPRSAITGQTLSQLSLQDRFAALPLALRHYGEVKYEDIGERKLVAGDVLLLLAPRSQRRAIDRSRDLIVISGEPLDPVRQERIYLALGIVVSVVLLAATDVLPVVVGAPVGAVMMVLTGCIDLDDAYRSIDWDVIFLLAGMLALGKAFAATGADTLLSDMIVVLQEYGPYVLVGTLYLVTLLLTSTMSNQATAALVTPIALSAAGALSISARPLIMAVTFAASSSFLTPVGYQTNTMVYGAGHYRFKDFVRLGGPLSILFAIIAALLIPQIWPL